MKKNIFCLSLLLVTCGGALFAQGNGAGVPAPVRQCFQKDYPGATAIAWQKLSNNWWNGSSRRNGQTMSKSCDLYGQGAKVAIPIMEGYIPENIAAAISDKYGAELYDITCIKGMDGNNHYMVRLLQKGELKTEQANL